MEVINTVNVDAPRDVVIEDMQDADVLEQVIPNCRGVEQVDEHSYVAQIHENVSMITLDLEADINIEDFNPPDSFSVIVEGQAPRSNTDVNADMDFELAEVDKAGTRIDYHMDISVTGKLASLGFRALKRTVQTRIDDMIQNIEDYFEAN